MQRDPVPIHGRLTLTVLDELGDVADQAAGDNIVCTTGFTALAAALMWSGIQDQAAQIGVTSPTWLTPLYGAIGSGTTAVAKGDTKLATELSRQVVGAGASSPATISIAAQTTFVFYFPSPTANWTITEAGVFANASSKANTGTMLDHWSFSPAVTVTPTQSAILQVSFLLGP